MYYVKFLFNQFNLTALILHGLMYRFGDGVLKNPEEAITWYRKAAEQGNAKAQNSLADAYCYGIGIVKDLKNCAYWAKKADDSGDDASGLWNYFELWKY